MSDSGNQTNLNKESNGGEFPVAAIACLSVLGYVVLVIGFLFIRRMLLSRGTCKSDCCSSENGTCCIYCAKISEACPCCCQTNAEGCLSTVCGKRKKTACIDVLLCNCCGCTEHCCEPCQGLIPNGLCHSECCSQSCHIGKKCFTCGPFCTSCSNDDLGPNTCGCLCLEVKLRTRRPDGQQRSISAPPNGVQSRHFSTHESTDKSSNIISDRNKENYQVSDIRKGSINRSKDDIQVGGGDILGHKQLSHYDTPKRASFLQQIPGDKSNNATMSDGNSVNMKYEYAQTNGQSNSLKTDFKETFEENAPSYYLTGSTNPSTYSTGDSSRNQSVKWMLNANNSGSSMESGGNSTSRSRRSIRPGQRSQRFPNKILISSKSFGSSGEKSNLSEISFIQSSGNSSLDSTPSQASALNLRRALPPLRHTVKPST